MAEEKQEQKKVIYFVRHAESEYNAVSAKGQEYVGANPHDTPLSVKGKKQAVKLAKKHQQLYSLACLYHTGLMRTRETIEPLQVHYPEAPLILLAELKEHSWGGLEGKLIDYHQVSDAWKAGETPIGAESYVEFKQRIKIGIEKLLAGPTPALVVAHGGVIRCILEMLGRPKRNINNTELFVCSVKELKTML